MPVPSRHVRPTGSSAVSTPVRPTLGRVISPPTTSTSYSPTLVLGGQQSRLNVVTRVAIEGGAKQGQDGASIKMYLKISLPLESVTPGTTIPLFPEENVKILTSQVHPIDNDSVPYNFSSSISPLLHNAARALNLPTRSSETYNAAFKLSPPSTSSSRVAKSINGSSMSENIVPVDGQYSGHILVSGYNISYVLPKVFPSRAQSAGHTDNENETYSKPPFKNRRASVGERNTAQFMAAIDMWVPYVSRPPRSPYLLSIPTPRCLHNNIKLRIFPPTTTSASFASLSSVDEEGSSWDLTSDPHVTRSASHRPSRSNSYTHFADDESSDSSTTGFSDGCGIQGTFPSAERIRVRWAKPLRTIDVPGGGNSDGRRRVGVKEVRGEMTCIIKGKLKDKTRNGLEGVLMDVEYKGTCKGVWFPGVATLLGMDLGLETKGSDVSWVDGFQGEWVVGGGVGYTGFDVGASPRQSAPNSRASSLDSNSPQILISSSSLHDSRHNPTSSTTSLLRAPLPAQHVAEYSFEGGTGTSGSPSSSHMGTVSSMSSLMPTSQSQMTPRPPGIPITLHINMNEIISPAKNIFTFSISGTILVTARSSLSKSNAASSSSSPSENDADPEPIVLPRFTVLAADSEHTSIIIRNEVDGASATIEVYNATGDIHHDAQARKTVLQKGGFTKCAEDGGRIALKSIGSIGISNANNKMSHTPSRPRTPNGNTLQRISSSSSLARNMYPSRPKRNGPLMIPSVSATITPLVNENNPLPDGYAVRVHLNAPADSDSEWLEFGLAQPGPGFMPSEVEGKPPRVMIASVSVEGVPVKFETSAVARPEASVLGLPFEEMSGKEWVSWVRIHVGPVGGGIVVIDYVVKERRESLHKKGKSRVKDEMFVFLPTFSIPVGRLDVSVDTPSGIVVSCVHSNFTHQQSTATGRRLLHYSMKDFFYPHLSLDFHPSPSTKFPSTLTLPVIFTWALFAIGFVFIHRLGSEVKQLGHSLESYTVVIGSGWNDIPEPVTITTTLCHSSTGTRWWHAENAVETDPASARSSSDSPSVIITPLPGLPDQVSALPLMSISHETKDIAAKPNPPRLSNEIFGLLPMQYFPTFPRTVQDLQATFDKVIEAVEMVWQLFRKAYHYPLDPT